MLRHALLLAILFLCTIQAPAETVIFAEGDKRVHVARAGVPFQVHAGLDRDFRTTRVAIVITRDGKIVSEQSLPVNITDRGVDSDDLTLEQPGHYQVFLVDANLKWESPPKQYFSRTPLEVR